MRKKRATHGETIRSEVLRLRRQKPFQPFELTLTDGRRLPIRQPNNIGFDPGEDQGRKGSLEFCVISGDIRFVGSFETVAEVVSIHKGDVP